MIYGAGVTRAALWLLVLTFTFFSRAAIRLDPEFDSGPGTELFAEQVIPLLDGKILVCGKFRWYNLKPAPYLMRLNEDGSPDPDFELGQVNEWIRHMAVQPDGRIIVAGAFSEVGGKSRNLIARLTPDGLLDESFDPGTGFEVKLVPSDPNPPFIFWFDLQPDGKIIVVGSFSKFNGQTAHGIARLNPDGTLDTTFQMGAGLNSWGRFVLVQPNGQILVTGWFTVYNGFACNRMVRLNADGTVDPTFRPFFGDKTSIYTAALQPDGKIIAAGHSKNDFGLFKREITRLNPDGTEDPSFLAHTNERTESILLLPDGRFYVCGWFDLANDTPRGRIARFLPDGSLDETFRADADFFVWNMAVDQKGRLLIAGGFPNVLGIPRLGIARLVEEGATVPPEPDPKPSEDPPSPPPVSVEPFNISSVELKSGSFFLHVQTTTNGTYYLERRVEVSTGDWHVIDSLPGNGALRSLIDFKPLPERACYRLRVE